MKKQILFLFAASALFAACSSEDMPNGNQGGDDNGQTVVSNTSFSGVTTAEGIGFSAGTFEEENANTKSADESVTIDITPDLEFMETYFEEYEIKADDFYIRKNGKFVEVKPMESFGSELPGTNIRVTSTGYSPNLKVRIQHLEELKYNADYNDDYTFEVYMWVARTTPKLNEGSGTEANLFTTAQKLDWINANTGVTDNDTENILNGGIDITTDSEAELYLKPAEGNAEPNPNGYLVRYNVFRGISGYQDGLFDENGIYIGEELFDADGNYVGTGEELGDTPYVKVSIHVNRLKDSQGSSITPVYPVDVE